MPSEAYTPKLEQLEPLSKPIPGKLLIDRSEEFDLPYALEELPRMSLFREADLKNSLLGRRSISEKRAYTFPPTIFKSHDANTVFCDLLVKGGGAEVSPNALLLDEIDYQNNKSTIIPSRINGNAVRYHFEPIHSLTSHLGIHKISAGLSDHYMSNYLAKRGLRTRELVAIWDLPDATEMSTPKGIITAKEYKEKTGEDPGIEAWAMRCKYRIHDITRFIHEISYIPEQDDVQTLLNISRVDTNGIKFVNLKKYPCHQFVPGEYSQGQLQQINNGLQELATAVTLRAQYDEDERFRQLAQNHKQVSDVETMRSFYTDYVRVLPEIFAEQLAIMDINHALSGMFNAQNVTMLSELVDNDVTMVDGKVMDEKGNLVAPSETRKEHFNISGDSDSNYFEQLQTGYLIIQKMLTDLNRTGIIAFKDEEIVSTLNGFLSSYFRALGKAPERQKERILGIDAEISSITEQLQEAESDDEVYDMFGDDWARTYITELKKVQDTVKASSDPLS